LTTARYYTPSGRSIQAEGISPDVPISKVKLELAAQSEFSPIKEADLLNHLENGNEKSLKKDETKDGGEKSEETLALQDYPLNEALNLLKGINIMRSSPKKN
jgi:carboxyl-terminal processing protease